MTLQEEATWLRVPLLVLRKTTGRPEGVSAVVAQLVGTEREPIVEHVSQLLDNPRAQAAMARGFNGHGDGKAATRIISALLKTRSKPPKNQPLTELKLVPPSGLEPEYAV